ncbi:MAG: DNA repair protein RecO [Pseudomonadota bacterium]
MIDEHQPSFVLHTRQYRETSLLVELLTQKSGRVCVLAKGVRGGKKSQSGLLQPFMPLMISWKGKGDLPYLRSVELLSEPFRFSSSILISAIYLNELLMRVLHRHDACEYVFDLYQATLHRLSNQKHEVALRLFEKYLLQELGYAIPLKCEAVDRQPIVEEGCYRFSAEIGFMRAEMKDDQGLFFAGRSLLAIARDDYSDSQVLKDAKRLMRLALSPLLGDKPIKTRELFI